MLNTSLLDSLGRVIWANRFHPKFPQEILCSLPIWRLAYGEHAERLMQAFSVACVIGEPQSGYYSLISPVDYQTYDFVATYQAVPATTVVCTWRRAMPVTLLTEREHEILVLSCADLDAKKIAERLNISESTVNYHWSSIRQKLAKETNMGALVEAIRQGLVDV